MENTQLSHWNNKSCNKPIVKHSISRGTCKKLGLDRNPLSTQDSPRCVYDCLVNSKYIGSTFISFKFLLILLSYNTSLAQVHFPIFLQFLSSPLLYPTSIPSSSFSHSSLPDEKNRLDRNIIQDTRHNKTKHKPSHPSRREMVPKAGIRVKNSPHRRSEVIPKH